jgi:hypothetical protein
MQSKDNIPSLGPKASPSLPATKVTPKPSAGKQKGNGKIKKCTLLETSRIAKSKDTAANQLCVSPLQQFESTTGKTSQGNKEVHAQFDMYFDSASVAATPWKPILVQTNTLPGITDTAAHRIKRSRFFVLPPGFSDNNASNNAMMLTGVAVEQTDSSLSLGCGTTTFLRPMVNPSWIEVLDCNFEQLIRNNMLPANYGSDAFELGRFSIVNPDNGNVQEQTTLQFKIVVDYAYSLQLLSPVQMSVPPTGSPISLPVPVFANRDVYPRALSLNNSI